MEKDRRELGNGTLEEREGREVGRQKGRVKKEGREVGRQKGKVKEEGKGSGKTERKSKGGREGRWEDRKEE